MPTAAAGEWRKNGCILPCFVVYCRTMKEKGGREMPLMGYRRVCARVAGVLLVLAAIPSAGDRLFSVASDAARYGLAYALCGFAVSVLVMLALVFLGVRVFSTEEERWPAACIVCAVVLLMRIGMTIWTVSVTDGLWRDQLSALLLPGFSVLWLALMATLHSGFWDFPRVFRPFLPTVPAVVFSVCLGLDIPPFVRMLRALSAADVPVGARLTAAGSGLHLVCLLLCGTAAVLVGFVSLEDCG